MNRFAIAVAGALLGAAGLAHPAGATSFVGSSLTIGGETFTIESCSASAAVCDGLQITQDGSNIGVTISAIDGGSIISGSSGIFSGADLGVELSVTGSSSIDAIGLALTGNDDGTPANDSAIGFGETITSSPTTAAGVTLANAGEQWVNLPGGYTSLDLIKDIYVHGPDLAVGTTGAVTTVTQDVQFGVPEPATFAVLLSGLVAAGLSRRTRRRS